MTFRAIIVGGGVAGLSTALSLRRIGWESVVLERADTLGDAGAGVQLSANAVRVLDGLGVGEAIRAVATVVETGTVRAGDTGRILVDLPLSERRWCAPYLHVHRADLIGCLAEAAGDVVTTGAPVQSVGQDAEGAWVRLEDGSGHRGDVVVGADGGGSRIRRRLWGDGYLVANGDKAVRRLVRASELGVWAPSDGAVSVWVGRGVHHVTYRVRGGELATIITVSERGSEVGDLSGWHGSVRAMHKAPASVEVCRDLGEVLGLHRWSKGRVVLVGDACHAFLPHMAQGAAMALEDAWVLAHMIARENGPVSAALSGLRSERVRRVVSVRQRSRRNRHLFHVDSAAGRNIAVAAMRIGLPLGSLDWLYRHDVTANGLKRQGD